MSCLQCGRNLGEYALTTGANEVIRFACPHAGKIAGESADIVGDRHIVIVKNNENIVIEMASVV